MIVSALINTAYYVLAFFINLFPQSSGFPSEVSSAFAYFGGYVGMLDPILPISTLATTVGIVFVVEGVIFSYRVLTWVFHKVPFIGK